MIKKLLLVLLLSIPFASFGQQHVLFRDSTTIDSFRLTMWVRQLIPPAVPKINPFFDSLGSAYLAPNGVWWRHNGVVWEALTTDPDSSIWATRFYVDSGLASISAGAVDTNNYIASITRLNTEIDSIAYIMDSLYVEVSTKQGADSLLLALQIETLNSDVTGLDSALGVAFGAISALYDTLPNYVDTAMLNDSLQAIKAAYVPYIGATTDVNIGTHTFTAKDGVFNHSSGSGIALSVTKGGNGEALTVNKTSGSGNAMSVTGGVTQLQELHTTTPIADAYIASAATWNAKGNGTVTSIQLVAGTGVTITPTTAVTTAGTYTISATGGGGGGSPTLATPYELLYKSGTDTIKSTPKVYVDTTDNRLVLAYDSTNSTVVADPNGGVKIWGSTRMGMGAVRILDTVSIPAALQRALNAQITSTIVPGEAIRFTNNFIYGGMIQTLGTVTAISFASYSSTSTQSCYNKILYLASASANQSAGLRVSNAGQSAGIICGNTKFGGGGGRGTITFALPVYNSGQRIYAAYTTSLGMLTINPSALPSAAFLAVGKDAADTFMSFYHNDNIGDAVKVPLSVIPNSDDVYRFTVYIAPNSAAYLQLEVISKTGIAVYTLNPTSNTPPVNTRLQMQTCVNSATTGVGVQLGIVQITEEIY